MTLEPRDDATRESRLWDEYIVRAELQNDADSEFLAEIRRLESLVQTPPPPNGLSGTTWEKITGEPLPLVPYAPALAPSTNGRHAVSAALPRPARSSSRQSVVLAEIYRLLAVAAMSGFAGGFLAGIWARIAMRASGFFTDDRNRGLLTDNDAVVGNMTLSGTLSIAMFGGVIGIVAGLLYVGIRRWLPGRGWQRPLAFGVLLLAVLGFVIMDKSNPDYRLFGPAWMNIGTFSLAYIVMGFTVGTIAEYLQTRLPAPGAADQSRRGNVVAGILMAPFAFFGGLGLIFIVVGTTGIGALVLLAIACTWIPVVRPNWTLRLPSFLQQPETFAYATLAIPSLFGLALTLRAIAAIAGG